MANWLITGGCGFIGLNLVKYLLSIDEINNIKIIDNMSVGKSRDITKILSQINIGLNYVEIKEADIEDWFIIEHLMKDIDYVVHLAAVSGVRTSVDNPNYSFNTNVIGTFRLLEVARKSNVKKFIFASSGAAVGDHKPPINEELPSRPVSPYGATKLAGEGLCTSYYHSFGLETISLRFSNVYGSFSHRKESLVAKLAKRILNNEEFNVYGDGKQTRDFIHVDDLIRAIRLCINIDNIGGEVFQLCTNVEKSVNDVVSTVCSMMRKKGFKDSINIKYVDEKTGDLKTNYADNTKIYKCLNWVPRVDFKRGISSTLDWLIKDHQKRMGPN